MFVAFSILLYLLHIVEDVYFHIEDFKFMLFN
jgi:hypothetical protein